MLNLTENAIRAAAACPPEGVRTVSLRIHTVKGQAFLKIDNTYCGTLQFSPVTHLPLSRRGGEHGFGLRSVLAFAQKHQATLSCTAENGIFHTRLLIPIPQN